jgi:ribosome-associated protein
MVITLDDRDYSSELHFSASRSSGPGGQHVNKVSTKVELRFHVSSSQMLSEEEKVVIAEKLASRINLAGELVLVSQSERTQLKNREKVTEKFYDLLRRALTPRKKRKATRVPFASKEARLESKRQRAVKKELRRDPEQAL